MNQSQLSSGALAQLNKVDIRSYTSFLDDLFQLANGTNISKIWISSSASQAIFSRIPVEKRLISSKFDCYFIENQIYKILF